MPQREKRIILVSRPNPWETSTAGSMSRNEDDCFPQASWRAEEIGRKSMRDTYLNGCWDGGTSNSCLSCKKKEDQKTVRIAFSWWSVGPLRVSIAEALISNHHVAIRIPPRSSSNCKGSISSVKRWNVSEISLEQARYLPTSIVISDQERQSKTPHNHSTLTTYLPSTRGINLRPGEHH